MRRALLPGALGLLVLCLAVPASAQEFLVRASRTAVVRDIPSTAGRELGRLERGEALNCVTAEQTDRFYRVFLSGGETGWVSRYVVRLEEGRAEGAPIAGAAPGLETGLTPEQQRWAALHLAVGAPAGYQEIVREGYALGYDPRLKIASWVQYRLTLEMSEDNSAPDTRDFRPDGAVRPQARAIDDDYRNSGYARGHGAPLADLRYSDRAASESNLFTNISPQVGAQFNSSVWGTIEEHVRGWVLDRRDLLVITGPVFRPGPASAPVERQPQTPEQMVFNVVGANRVAVPSAFFKIVVDMRNPERPDVVAFLVDHIVTKPRDEESAAGVAVGERERDPERWLTSVDEIERQTGLDFLTGLSEDVQRDIESVETVMW